MAVKRTRILLILDSFLFLALVFLAEPQSGGLTVHEWLGLAVTVPIIVHLLLAWRWITALPSRLRAPDAWRLRFNALLNSALFVAFTITVFSGAMTSFVALPALGIAPGDFEGWRLLHRQAEAFLEIAVGLHVAMNGSWIVHALGRVWPARGLAPDRASDVPVRLLKP